VHHQLTEHQITLICGRTRQNDAEQRLPIRAAIGDPRRPKAHSKTMIRCQRNFATYSRRRTRLSYDPAHLTDRTLKALDIAALLHEAGISFKAAAKSQSRKAPSGQRW